MRNRPTQVHIPTLVRVKPGALDRVGIYLSRFGHRHVGLVHSAGLPEDLVGRMEQSLQAHSIACVSRVEADAASFEQATELFRRLPVRLNAIVGLGGGKALDVAKYVAFLAQLPYYAVPASLSNDGFCSPQSSLTMSGARRSLAAALPFAVVIDVDVCLQAPRSLWLSGVGDLMAKLTAIFDWKLAFHQKGELVDDFAALLSDATVRQFMGRPVFDREGTQLLGTALMFNGIAMEVCGSSRPASGSEHLLSHALDAIADRPRLHGLQVGMATYIVSRLQDNQSAAIAEVFERTGFWEAIRAEPFLRAEWLKAARLAPTIKENFYTILSTLEPEQAVAEVIDTDPQLRECFTP